MFRTFKKESGSLFIIFFFKVNGQLKAFQKRGILICPRSSIPTSIYIFIRGKILRISQKQGRIDLLKACTEGGVVVSRPFSLSHRLKLFYCSKQPLMSRRHALRAFPLLFSELLKAGIKSLYTTRRSHRRFKDILEERGF